MKCNHTFFGKLIEWVRKLFNERYESKLGILKHYLRKVYETKYVFVIELITIMVLLSR